MCLYNLGYYSYEESCYIQLYHEKKLSKEEFERIIIESASNIIQSRKDNHLNFQDILVEVMEDLVKNQGFKQLEFDAEFKVFGWAHILDKSDWKEEREELLDMIADFANIRHKKI